MKTILKLCAICVICGGFAGSAFGQNTLVTGTFKTPEGKTPAQASLKSSATIGATPIYGKAYFRATDLAGNQVRELTFGGVTYVGEALGFIKSDGTLISYAETSGVRLIPTIGASPAGLAYCLELQWNGSIDGRVAPQVIKGKNLCKNIPDQASVDWATLPVASLVASSYGYQTGLAGAMLNYENWTCVTSASVPTPAVGFDNFFCDSADSNKLKRKISDGSVVNVEAGGGGSTTISIDGVNLSTQSPLNFQDTSEIDWTNPSAGNVQIALKAASVADSKLATISTTDKVSAGAINDGGAAATQALFSGAAGAAGFRAIAESDVVNLTTDLAAKVPTTRMLTGGAGIAAIGDLSADRTIAVDSAEAGFLSVTPQTCGAGTAGRAWVDTTSLRYCDNSGTPTLQPVELQNLKNTASGYAGLNASALVDLARGGTNANLSATGGANQFLKQNSAGAAITVGAIADADVPDNIAITVTGTAEEITVTGTAPPVLSIPAVLNLSGKTLKGGSPLVFDGLTADANKTSIVVTDPTAARSFTLPNADSNSVQPITCSGTDKFSAISALGVITCSTDAGGAGSGDNISVNGVAAVDADFDDATPAAPANSVNVKWQKDALTPNNISAYVTAIPDSALASNYSGIGACGANSWASTLNDNAAPTCTQPGFGNLSGSIALAQTPLTTLGDMLYADATPSLARLAGQITTTKKYLSQTGNGAISAAPVWSQPAFSELSGSATAGQVPNLENLNGILTAAKGGTGANNAATTGRYLRADGTNFVTSSVAAAGAGTCTNQFVRATVDNAVPTCATVGKADAAATFVHTDQSNTYSGATTQDMSGITALKLPAAAAAAPTADGDCRYDTTQKATVCGGNGAVVGRVPRLLATLVCNATACVGWGTGLTAGTFTNNCISGGADSNCTNAGTTETAFGFSYTNPANFLGPNNSIRADVYIERTATATVPTFLMKMKVGGTIVFQSATLAAVAGAVTGMGASFKIQGVSTLGASVDLETGIIGGGPLANTGFIPLSYNTIAQPVAGFNTTTTNALTFTMQYGAATIGNFIRLRQVDIWGY